MVDYRLARVVEVLVDWMSVFVSISDCSVRLSPSKNKCTCPPDYTRFMVRQWSAKQKRKNATGSS
jgi:hypothetical protein